jgi:CDP-diacylglycerol--serine O-phosphatidyltransferase
LIWLTLLYTLGVASLMVSRLPVYSGKRFGARVPPELVGPLIVVVVLFFALLIAYPWIVLTIGTVAYMGSLPFGWLSYREYERKSRESRADASQAPVPHPAPAATTVARPAEGEDRPSRLN